MRGCLHESDFERLHSGEFAAPERERLEAHLTACATCAIAYQEFVRVADQLRALKDAQTHASLAPESDAGRMEDPVGRGEEHRPPADSIPGYDLLREVHRGGQGVVYQAVQRSTRRRVAVKVLREGPFAGPADRSRFEREVRILAQLSHPNIVAIHDSGISSGLFYFVMDYVSGPTLDAHAANLRRSVSGTEFVRSVLRLFLRIGSALHVAHSRGVVHRDLKPANVRIAADGEPCVLDFGLAKLAASPDASRMTMTGQFLGSLPWAAPEQAEGRPDKIDARTDVYALGVMLFQMLTGRFPYDVTGGIHDTLHRILHAEPVRPGQYTRQIDDEVETIILKCLHKERERRYAHAGELAQDIERYLEGLPIEAKRASSWYLLRKRLPRYKVAGALALAALMAVLGLGAWSIQRARVREQTERLAAQLAAQREQLVEQCQDAVLLMDAGLLERLLVRAPEVQLDAGRTHVYRGWASFAQVDMERALDEANAAIRVSPELADAYFLRAGVHAFHNDRVPALADYSKARSLASGAVLHETFDGILQLAMGRLDEGLATMDRLVQRRQSAGLCIWMRGFGRWMVLLRYPQPGLEDRWRLATLAMDDLNAAAKLYPSTLFVFDVRIDLTLRMIEMAPYSAQRPAIEPLAEQCRDDCARLTKLGAAGPALRGLAALAWTRRDFAECERQAQAAHDLLKGPAVIKGIHYRDAGASAMNFLLLTAFLEGDDVARERLAALADQERQRTARFVYSFVRGAVAERATLLAERTPLGDPGESDVAEGMALWLGAVVRGDVELARQAAARCTVSAVARLTDRWPGTLVRFLQGRETTKRLRAAAGDDAAHVGRARLIDALTRPTREECLAELRALHALALSDSSHETAVILLARAERDPAFLTQRVTPAALRGSTDAEGGKP